LFVVGIHFRPWLELEPEPELGLELIDEVEPK
jgi:hypothetical protein